MMNALKWIPLLVLTAGILTGCGSDDDDNDADVAFSLGISDAPVDDANKVVITIESVTLRTEGADDLVFETFSNSDAGLADEKTVQIDLLEYQGAAQFTILENEEIPPGSYSDMILEIFDEDVSLSYVEETDGSVKPIKVPSDELKLGSFEVGSDAPQNFTIEFNLRKSMTYNPGPDRYILKPQGISLVDNANSGSISGVIDLNEFLADSDCAGAGRHLVYLYAGNDLNTSLLSDQFDPEVNNNGAPAGAIAPYASTGIALDEDSGEYRYEFGFVPAGTHTLAYACDAGEDGDDPEMYDGIMVPLPEDDITEVTVSPGATTTQNFPTDSDKLTLGISDAPVDSADEVVVTVDIVTFKQEGNNDQIFDCFLVAAEANDTDDEICPASSAEGKVYKDQVTLNLLEYTGSNQFILLDSVDVTPGDYSDVWLDVLDENLELAYVNEQLPEGDDLQDEAFIKDLKVPSGTLKLGGFSFDEEGIDLTIDFNLRKSMTYNPGPERYILKPHGISLVINEGTGSISGEIGAELIASEACSATEATATVYLYAGTPSETETLGDEYDPELPANSEVTATEPFASIAASETGQFSFGFVPEGTHTLALYCGNEEDHPETYDSLAIPSPEGARVNVTVTDGEETVCDLSADASCQPEEDEEVVPQ